MAPWITVLSWQTLFTRGWFTNLLWCYIPWKKAPWTGPHHIWRIYTLFPSLATRRTQTAAEFGWWFRWPVLVMATRVTKHLLRLNLVFQRIWGWCNLGSFQLPQSNSSPLGAWNLCGYIFFLAIANNYNSLPYLVSSVWVAQFQKPDATEIWTSSTVTAKQI